MAADLRLPATADARSRAIAFALFAALVQCASQCTSILPHEFLHLRPRS